MAKTSAATVETTLNPEFEKEHQVLYRKFRPRQFADVVGQDHIIKPLQSKVAERKVGHAYLFVGPRGCGKTTTARLLAAASNCPNVSLAGEPCGNCATCNGIISGSGAIGLHELDAASNRGVADMLDLISTMGQGSVARKKVYIVDEALALDTPIPTPTGWTTMGDIVPGDHVLGTGGYPVKVVRTTEIAEGRPCYRVTFSDGTSVVADENHKWMVEPRKGTYGNNMSPARVMTTGQMFVRKNGGIFRLPRVEAVDLPEVEVPVDPYLLGFWLGDGSKGQPHLTVRTPQVDAVMNELSLLGETVKVISNSGRSGCARVSVGGGDDLFSRRMVELGVFYDKHIPSVYLRGSLKQRLALLQGLMDSDGYVNQGGTCTFVNTNTRIIDGVVEILRSLGYSPTVGKQDDGNEAHQEIYKVSFRGNPAIMPFRTRDTEKVVDVKQETRKRIVSIEPTISVPVRCIEVEAEDHLFLAGDGMAATHNCHMLTKEASNALLKTLEEPPADTLIILATTEANKVLPTIQSRAVRYNFKLIDPDTMTKLIKEVVEAIGMDIDEDGISEVVRRGHGSPRDTLTALEGYGGEAAGDDVTSFIPNIAAALVEKNSADLIISIAEAINGGVDVQDLTRSLLAHWRNCLLALEAPTALDLSSKEVSALAKQAKSLKPNRVVRLLNVTSEALGKMAASGDERLLLETTLLQVALPSASDSLDGIYEMLEDMQDTLDDILKKGVPVSSAVASSVGVDWPPLEEDKVVAPKSAARAVEPKPEPVKVEEEPAEPVLDESNEEKQEEAASEESEEIAEDPISSYEPDPVDDDGDDDYSQLDDDAESDDDESGNDSDGDGDYDDYDDDPDNGSDDDGDYDDYDDDPDNGSDDDEENSDDEEPLNDISALLGDPVEEDEAADKKSKKGPVHNHEDDDESGFLECEHPDCVDKNSRLEKGSKAALQEQKTRKAEKVDDAVRMFFDEDDAPTAADLVERIQHDIVDRKYSRYLQDTVMDAELEKHKGKTYLVLILKKNSSRIPTKDAIDAIMDAEKHLWVDGIEYEGEER